MLQDPALVLSCSQMIERVMILIQTSLIHAQIQKKLELCGVTVQSTHMDGGLTGRELDLPS